MGDPTVVCRSCGITAAHAPDDPMALCPACGAALPLTLEVRQVQGARPVAPDLPGVRRPEPLWDTGGRGARRTNRGGLLLWVALLLAIAAAAALWRFAPTLQIAP